MLARLTSAGCGCKKVTSIISYRFLATTYVRSTRYNDDHNNPTDERKKFLNIAVIGQPNVGKSSLVNRVVGERVSVVLSRSHTTRRSTKGILNVGNTQLVFTDTPGTVSYEEARRLSMHKDHIRAPLRISGKIRMIMACMQTVGVMICVVCPVSVGVKIKKSRNVKHNLISHIQLFQNIYFILFF